jgi:large subunit ribosomal protein L9
MGERGKAFGSITGKEISEGLAKLGYTVDKKDVNLDKPIKTEGVFEVELKLYKGVFCKLKVAVKGK